MRLKLRKYVAWLCSPLTPFEVASLPFPPEKWKPEASARDTTRQRVSRIQAHPGRKRSFKADPSQRFYSSRETATGQPQDGRSGFRLPGGSSAGETTATQLRVVHLNWGILSATRRRSLARSTTLRCRWRSASLIARLIGSARRGATKHRAVVPARQTPTTTALHALMSNFPTVLPRYAAPPMARGILDISIVVKIPTPRITPSQSRRGRDCCKEMIQSRLEPPSHEALPVTSDFLHIAGSRCS